LPAALGRPVRTLTFEALPTAGEPTAIHRRNSMDKHGGARCLARRDAIAFATHADWSPEAHAAKERHQPLFMQKA